MKTYKQLMDEAVSPTRLAQLAAKGKGPAAAAKMKADGLTRPPVQGTKEKARRVAQGQAGLNKGGPLVKANNSIVKSGPSALSTKPADKGRAIVKQKSSAITPSKPGALATQRPNKPGDNSNKMGRVPKPYRSGPNREDDPGPQSKPQKPSSGKDDDKNKKNPAWEFAKGVGKRMRDSVKDGPGESSGGSIQAPRRGVYNG